MNYNIHDITNKNTINNPKDEHYAAFNDFIFSKDIKLTGKLLHRFNHFLNTRHLPGDIVEIGVFKGSGIATFAKFVNVFCPNSNKKIIGFDIFDTAHANKILNKDSELDKECMNIVYNRVNSDELTYESVIKRLDGAGICKDRYELVQGDVEQTIPGYVEENPGFRISMLYIDVDLERPTYFALKHLWDRILPGGVVIFDEFEYGKFTESCGVERFLREKNIKFELKSTDWIAPTAYLYKTDF